MRNPLLIFKEQYLNVDMDFIKSVANAFYSANIVFSEIFILSKNDKVEFQNVLEKSSFQDDVLFIIEPNILSFDINKVICEVLKTSFSINEKAKSIIEELNEKINSNYSINNAMIPVNAILLANTEGEKQGYILEDKVFSLIKLPSEINLIKNFIQEYIVRFFENKFNLRREVFTLKYFGDKDKLFFALKEIENKYNFVKYSYECKYGDYLVQLVFDGDVSKKDYDEAVRLFISRVKDGVYAEFDTSLSSRLFDLLKLAD